MLPERNQQPVDLDPVLFRQLALEREHRLLRRRGGDVAPTVRNPPDVHVDTDARLAAGDAEREIRALRPDTLERRQHVEAARQLAAELFHRAVGDLAYLTSLPLVRRRLANQSVDRAHR